MLLGVLKETFPGERRVALAPSIVPLLLKGGNTVVIEAGAGAEAGFLDAEYREKGATIAASRQEVLAAECLLQVRAPGSQAATAQDELSQLRKGQLILGMCDPLGSPALVQQYAERGVTLFALELVPRITRAQSMDVLSSQATVAGYRAVILAAEALPKMFPMMMTAAGTISAAKVLVIGAGVAGLQAIAVSRKLGGVVCGYDVRAAVKEQIESLGAKFVELALDTAGSEGQGGYAKAQGEEFYKRQRELLGQVVAQQDVVITTAAIPGRPSPRLITAEAVQAMHAGSVIVDLAAERGGNCELTEADKRVVKHGVTLLGPTNLPADVPLHASQMFAKNVATLVAHLAPGGTLKLDLTDEITRETMAAHEGQVTSAAVRDRLGIASPIAPGSAGGSA